MRLFLFGRFIDPDQQDRLSSASLINLLVQFGRKEGADKPSIEVPVPGRLFSGGYGCDFFGGDEGAAKRVGTPPGGMRRRRPCS
jgi:hypothetical protein